MLNTLQEDLIDTNQLRANRAIGEHYMNNNNRKAIIYFEKARTIATQLNRRLDVASNLYSMAYCYMQDGKYDKSLDNYFQSIRIYEELKDNRRLANAYLTIIEVYSENKSFDKAVEYYEKARTLIESRHDTMQLCTLMAQRANIFYHQNLFDSSLVYLNREYEYSMKLGDEMTIISTLGNIGLQFKKLNHLEQALDYSMRALDRLKHLTNVNDYLSQLYNNIGSIHAKSGDFTLAKQAFDSSINYCKEIGASTLEMENYRNLSDMYGQMHNYRLQIEYLTKYHTIKDSVFTNDTKNQLTELEAEYQLGKKNIELVKKDRDLKDQKNQRTILILIALSTLLLLSALFYFYKRMEHRKALLEEKNMQIIEQRNELENLNHVKDRLFSVISHDLRNPLVTLRSYLTLFENDQLSKEKKELFKNQTINAVTQTGEMLDNLLTWANMQIKNDITSITPIRLYDGVMDVIAILQAQAQQKKIRLISKIDDIIIPGDYDILSIAIRNIITNAIKFSHENQSVFIETRCENSYVSLTVKDEGIGMTSEQIRQINQFKNISTAGTRGEKGSGLGLFLVKELLLKINAELFIESKVGEGSCFTIRMSMM